MRKPTERQQDLQSAAMAADGPESQLPLSGSGADAHDGYADGGDLEMGSAAHAHAVAGYPAKKQPDSVDRMKLEGSQGVFNLQVLGLTYKVNTKVKKVMTEKVLLHNVTVTAHHSQLLAVVGPSGAGKSTFLDAVAGRIDPRSLQGAILVNGKAIEPSFKRQSGYVMQDEALFPLLSVRETLLFSARLRLPGSMSMAEKKERVEMLIAELGLTSCADTKIGNEEVRGVSGGERRRTSIGVDLIHDPPVLFLDEPTSGLDSTSALNVVQNLNRIAEQRRRTIVLTIHQPSFRILELIHNYLVLAKGNVVYSGPYSGLIGYFRDFGKDVPEHVNTLEYALDLIEEQEKRDEGLKPLLTFYESKQQGKPEKTLSMQSSMGTLLTPEFASNIVSETLTLCDRNARNTVRTKELFLGRAGVMVVTGLIVGSLFWNVGLNAKGIQSRESFFIFSLAAIIFTSTEALPIFLAERQIYIRETSRGAYRTSSYVIANALVFLPFLFGLALIFSGVSYFMIGLYSSVDAFFMFVTIIFLAFSVANSYVTFWSGIVPNYILGNTIATATTAFMFLFSGFFLPRNEIPKYWIWLHYMSNFKYPLELLENNEYNHLQNACWAESASGECLETSPDILRSFSAGRVHSWENCLIMALLFVGWRLFFYVALRFQTAAVRR